jgi:uncharacterized protein with HEPN domain
VPSRDPTQRFEDILENIVLIEEFTAGMDLTAFTEDLKTSNAVERCLGRISEAARKLGGAAEELCPAIPWPQLRAIAPLKTSIEAALKQLRESGG